jgi:hypothetical protein
VKVTGYRAGKQENKRVGELESKNSRARTEKKRARTGARTESKSKKTRQQEQECMRARKEEK